MKRIHRILFLVAACFSLVAQGADYSDGYYSRMDGKSKDALKKAAKECVSTHTRLVYSDLPVYWQYSDVYPEKVDGQTRWWEMYSDNVYLIKYGQSAKSSFSSNRMQREHAIPKSWWKKNNDVEYTPAYSDLWNLFPSDANANLAKLNYPFGPVRNATFDNGVTKVGPAMSGFGGGSSNVFEPGDEYKGDFARAIFYMATVYDDLPWCINYMFSSGSAWPTLREWAYNMLLQWSRTDPVSQKEIMRNNAVEKSQGNRNPFVDFPELAEYIWGTRTHETFYIAEQGGQVTPPITGDPEMTAPVNGESLDFGQAALGHTVSASLVLRGANLSSPLSVRVNGADKAMFVPAVKSIPASSINSGAEYLLPIAFTPTRLGQCTATLAIYDGGLPGGASINVTLRAEALEVPTLTTLTATEATNITPDSYQANWNLAPEVVDYYLVNRVRYLPDGNEGEQLQANENRLLMTERDADVMESYSVMSVRLGCVSMESNTIIVPGDSGVRGVDDVAPVEICLERGGFTIVGDYGTEVEIEIYDVYGRLIQRVRGCGGDHFPLPQATVCILRSNALRHSVKAISTAY